MINDKRVAVIVPAYNEEAWIQSVVEDLPSFVDRIVIVDDASSDQTRQCAERASCHCDKVILSQVTNEGVGAAILRGYQWAFQAGDDILAVMAGDGQMDPADLRAVVMPIAQGQADYVKGNRLRHASVHDVMPRNRRLGSYVLSALTSLVIGQVIGDSQCGYTAIARDAFARIHKRNIWPRYGYPNDLLAALALEGARIRDVVVRPVYRGEASGMHVGHVAIITALLGRAALRRSLRSGKSRASRYATTIWQTAKAYRAPHTAVPEQQASP